MPSENIDWMEQFKPSKPKGERDLTDLSLPMVEPTPIRSGRKQKRRDRQAARNFKKGL